MTRRIIASRLTLAALLATAAGAGLVVAQSTDGALNDLIQGSPGGDSAGDSATGSAEDPAEDPAGGAPNAPAASGPGPAADPGPTTATTATGPGPAPRAAAAALAAAGAPSLIEAVRLDQSAITAGDVAFERIMEIGRHLYTQSFSEGDGYGEGPTGPRETRRAEYAAGPMAAYANLPWMRLHGLDAQACLECHSVSGMEAIGTAVPDARNARRDGVAGAGQISSSAIINPMLESPAPSWVRDAFEERGIDPETVFATFLRNPPHVFGAGYTQRLAEEMTFELLAQRRSAIEAAVRDPGQGYQVDLGSKGTSFGVYTVRASAGVDFDRIGPCGDNPWLEEVCDGIDGVSEDLVVRPFQWKGIASNMRNFVRDALNFHFGMVPVELSPTDPDPDGDGHLDEISVGEVTALTAFALGVRPPEQVVPQDAAEAAAVARGRAVFEGAALPAGYGPEAACASCHHPGKTLADTRVTVHDPITAATERYLARESSAATPPLTVTGTGVGLGQATPRALPLPVEAAFAAQRPGAPESARLGFGEAYAFDLNMTGVTPLTESLPRLEGAGAEGIAVPLYSDLKRHRMGRCLADVIVQQVDREGIFVPRDQYLTRPLWGVGDTGPWLHDGRALSLEQAVLMHSDAACPDDGSGLVSAANPAASAYAAMPQEDRAALIAFLRSLRLPRPAE